MRHDHDSCATFAPFDTLARAGAKPRHLDQALRAWLGGASIGEGGRDPRRAYPAAVAGRVDEVDRELAGLVRVARREADADGGEALLLELGDGKRVEAVLLPGGSLCLSTQVGCAVGCTFCSTGTLGLERQMSAAEILAEYVAARRIRDVHRVVFMGMGEPIHNLEAVLAAIDALCLSGEIKRKDLMLSTVGDPRAFERMARNRIRPSLALSLHTTDAERRRELLPRAPRIAPRELVDAALDYARGAGVPLLVQWTLLAGVNDGDDELERLGDWLEGERAIVQFIAYNPVEGFAHERTSGDRAHAMTRALHARGIVAKLRESAGQGVNAACGQLRGRRQEPVPPRPVTR